MSARAATALAAGLLALAPAAAPAQQTRTAATGMTPPAATIDQLAWLAGEWEGEGLGGQSLEAYSPPRAGQITGHFIRSEGGKVAFYELIQIVPQGRSLAYRLRHFNPDLTGWEDAKGGKAVEFTLVAVEGDAFFFDGLTYRRTGPDTMEAWVRIHGKDGMKEQRFAFRRAR